jgi:hypothetical protein
MKKFLIALIAFLLLFPQVSYCQNKGDDIFGLIVAVLILLPYYIFSLVPFFITLKNNGENLIVSGIVYIFCLTGVLIATYHGFGWYLPTIKDFDIIYVLMILPFALIMIFTIYKHYAHKNRLNSD